MLEREIEILEKTFPWLAEKFKKESLFVSCWEGAFYKFCQNKDAEALMAHEKLAEAKYNWQYKKPKTKVKTKAKPKGKTEAQVKSVISEFLNHLPNCRVWNNAVGGFETQGGGFSQTGLGKGTSDLIGIYKGRFLAVEVKRETWKTPNKGTKAYQHFKNQKDFIDVIVRLGGYAGFAQSVEDVEKILELK